MVIDEYMGYRPNSDTPLPKLAQQFADTRAETMAIVAQLGKKPNILTESVLHNDMGDTTIRSWLQYIDMHGTYELRNVA